METVQKTRKVRSISKRAPEKTQARTQVTYNINSQQEYIGYSIVEIEALIYYFSSFRATNPVEVQPRTFLLKVPREVNKPLELYEKKTPSTYIGDQNFLSEFMLDEDENFSFFIKSMLSFISQ